jgi:hypothetical protein
MRYTIRDGQSYYIGTARDIVKWSKQECYNEVMRHRQDAARRWLMSGEGHEALVDLVLA